MNLIDVYKDRELAIRFLYELLLEREPHENISFEKPTKQEHRRFVCSRPYRVWYILEVEEKWVGAISASLSNEIGIRIAKQHRGNGYAPAAIKMLCWHESNPTGMLKPLHAVRGMRSGHWLANVNPKNEKSIAMFQKLGFKLKQMTYAYEAV